MPQLDTYFKKAAEAKASDLHLLAGVIPTLRVNGELISLEKEKSLTAQELEKLISDLLSKEALAIYTKQRELDMAHEVDGARYRINLHFEKGNMALAARVIPGEIPSPEELMIGADIKKFLDLPHGLILVTGPTGSGKSTTLASMIAVINSESRRNIITLEDPIEFLFKPDKSLIHQRELGRDMLSFAEGIKHALRQDPDVVLVGEMRDLETISTTLTLAETGHLVFATLHTSSTWQTIERIIDVFPSTQQVQVRLQLTNSLRAVIAQQLLPKIGGGRVAAREILVNNPAVSNLIRENKISQIKTVLQTSAKEGMITMDQALKNLVKSGMVDKSEADQLLLFKD